VRSWRSERVWQNKRQITKIAAINGVHYILLSAVEGRGFRRIIREQFVQMYKEHDVLQEVLDWARKDLKEPKGLPDKRPERGALDIEQVLDGEYAFA
jgi:hypothetical protein